MMRRSWKVSGLPLAGAAALIVIAWLAGGASWLVALAGIAGCLLLGLAWLQPRARELPANPPAERLELPPVSAEDLSDALPDPVVVFACDGGIVHANPAAVIAFGEFAPGMPVTLKFRSPEMLALLEKVMEQGTATDPVDYAEKLPVERLHRVFARPVGKDGGHFVLEFHDLSEVRRIERMRADFIANASHELRTPLASIAGFVETLRGPARHDPKAREQFLEIMHAQTTRMARLIDDLLSLSRLEMRSAISPHDRADIVHVMETVLESLSHQAGEAGVTFERDIPDHPVEVNGDHDELFQVFENLVENAIKYGGSGGRVSISIDAGTAPDDEVRVRVRDYGPGIESEHIPRITERFYRVDVGGRTQKGTGLGLAIVKHILTRHGARLAIASEPGEGATFTVSFPRV